MATKKLPLTTPKARTKKPTINKTAAKKTVVVKKNTADQILKSIKRKTTVAQKKIKSTAVSLLTSAH